MAPSKAAKPPETKLCSECDATLAIDARKCEKCGAEQARRCIVCQTVLPRNAFVCSNGHIQIPWSHLSVRAVLSLSTTLIIGLLVYHGPEVMDYLRRHFGRSATSIKVIGADDKAVYVRVSNTGPKSSILRTYEMSFANVHIESVPLRLTRAQMSEGKAVIGPDSEVTVALTVPGLLPSVRTAGSPARFTKTEIDDEIRRGGEVTLDVFVQESDDTEPRRVSSSISSRRPPSASDTFPATRISDFILAKVPTTVN